MAVGSPPGGPPEAFFQPINQILEVVIKGFIIAGTNSGCGKTTITLGIMALLERQGFKVAPFKVGPDYIDPGHHSRITGRASRNLDGWMLSEEYNRQGFERHLSGNDLAVVEGVMGLYDGYDGKSEAGSTAQMAKWLDLPVILVVNARSMARSGAALVSGFENFDRDLKFAGVVFNQLGSKRHLEYLTEAMEGNVTMPCLGGILRNSRIEIPERHLGLVTDDEHVLSDDNINRLADLMEEGLDLSPLLGGLSPGRTPTAIPESRRRQETGEVRIAVARDKAFCFYYPDNLEILEKNGAEIVFFSPVEDKKLPENIDGIYFGGGYPELFASDLSANRTMIEAVREMSRQGMPIYGECGGFMYLCSHITDQAGTTFKMTGCFPFGVVMLNKLKALGYREITLEEDAVIGKKGAVVRGHEFHYSEVNHADDFETVYSVKKRVDNNTVSEGYRVNNTLGSYLHLHFGSNPDTGGHFVQNCVEYKKKRTTHEA